MKKVHTAWLGRMSRIILNDSIANALDFIHTGHNLRKDLTQDDRLALLASYDQLCFDYVILLLF